MSFQAEEEHVQSHMCICEEFRVSGGTTGEGRGQKGKLASDQEEPDVMLCLDSILRASVPKEELVYPCCYITSLQKHSENQYLLSLISLHFNGGGES